MYTISFHHGAQVSLEHNRRNKKVVSKEAHIDSRGKYEQWHNEDVREAYKKAFGKAQEEYNLRQTRDDRKIINYYDNIVQGSKKENGRKPLYEAIITIGNADNKPSEELSYKILKDYFKDFRRRNPNLYVVHASYHADEPGAAPHMHIDYFPVAKGYKRGMSVQNGLDRALQQQGLKSQNKSKTAVMAFQEQERNELERLCKSRGLEISKPTEKKRKHYETQEYKLKTQISQLQSQRDKAIADAERAKKALENANKQLERYNLAPKLNLATELNDLRLDNKKLKAEIELRRKICLDITDSISLSNYKSVEHFIQTMLRNNSSSGAKKKNKDDLEIEYSYFDTL